MKIRLIFGILFYVYVSNAYCQKNENKFDNAYSAALIEYVDFIKDLGYLVDKTTLYIEGDNYIRDMLPPTICNYNIVVYGNSQIEEKAKKGFYLISINVKNITNNGFCLLFSLNYVKKEKKTLALRLSHSSSFDFEYNCEVNKFRIMRKDLD